MMDRLSAYAARESESDSPEDRQAAETEATVRLLEKLQLSKDAKPSEETSEPQNGDAPNAEETSEADGRAKETTTTEHEQEESKPQTNGDHKKAKGIPDNVRLFEVFHEQVMNLVSMQRLPIQDVTALLVSLINLAL